MFESLYQHTRRFDCILGIVHYDGATEVSYVFPVKYGPRFDLTSPQNIISCSAAQLLLPLFGGCWLRICCVFLCPSRNNIQQNRFIALRRLVCLCITFNRMSSPVIISKLKPLYENQRKDIKMVYVAALLFNEGSAALEENGL